jgi:hypothetical protein
MGPRPLFNGGINARAAEVIMSMSCLRTGARQFSLLVKLLFFKETYTKLSWNFVRYGQSSLTYNSVAWNNFALV